MFCLIILVLFMSTFLGCYLLAVFTNVPGISYVRDLWIETAMGTMNHRWLATSFFPSDKIEAVTNRRASVSADILGGVPKTLADVWLGDEFDSGLQGTNLKDFVVTKTLFPDDEVVGSLDVNGNEVVVRDEENGIKVVKVTGKGYVGYLALVADPSKVVIGHSSSIGSQGDRVIDIMQDHGAVLAVNASGFVDVDGMGNGGSIVGWSISSIDDASYGWDAFSRFASVGLTEDNNLIVGKIRNPKDYAIRDLAQFGPVLIANGEIVVSGSAGWGIQPRTIVGQRADGVIAFLVVDGRQPLYSVGIEIGEAAEILSSYGVYNASACDGGASSVMAYKDSSISQPCTRNPDGRRVPNAFLVMPSDYDSDEVV